MSPIEDLSGIFMPLEVIGEVTEWKDDVGVPIEPSMKYSRHVGVKVPAGAFLGLVANYGRDTHFGFTGLDEGAVVEHNTFADGQIGGEISKPEQLKPSIVVMEKGIEYKVT